MVPWASITEVEFDLAPNAVMERQVQRMSMADYPKFFNKKIRGNALAVMHNADLVSADSDEAIAVTWMACDKALTVSERLHQPGESYGFDQAVTWSVAGFRAASICARTWPIPCTTSSIPSCGAIAKPVWASPHPDL
jgi:hypothetical protein